MMLVPLLKRRLHAICDAAADAVESYPGDDLHVAHVLLCAAIEAMVQRGLDGDQMRRLVSIVIDDGKRTAPTAVLRMRLPRSNRHAQDSPAPRAHTAAIPPSSNVREPSPGTGGGGASARYHFEPLSHRAIIADAARELVHRKRVLKSASDSWDTAHAAWKHAAAAVVEQEDKLRTLIESS